jgi:hypothetical protein
MAGPGQGGGVNIHLHVERLILDGVNMNPYQYRLLAASLERELVRFLTRHGIGSGVRGGGAFETIRTNSATALETSEPSRLGRQIARSLHGGLNL